IEVALAAVWRARGFAPAAVVGHSMGEVAASCVAGALSIEQAVAVICRRSRLLRRTSGKGAMAVVELPMAEAQEALRGREHLLAVAVSNSSRSTVISGDPAALDALIAELEPREVFCRRVKVDVASHSPQMDPLRPDLLAALDGMQPSPGQVPFYSTVSGELTSGTALDSEYWADNLRSPVLFSAAVQRLIADGHTTFIEMSPHPILIPAVEEGLRDSGQPDLVAVPSLRRDEDEAQALLNALAMLYVAGHPIAWSRLYAASGRHVDLPTYPWQRERHWFETISQLDLAAGDGARSRSAGSSHPLLRQRLDVADRPGSRVWELTLDKHSPGYLRDHRVGGAGLVPASVYIELFLAVAADLGLTGAFTLTGLAFERPLRVPDGDEKVAVQIIAVPEGTSRAVVRVFARVDGDWQLHVSGRVEAGAATADAAVRTFDRASGRVLDRDEIYDALHRTGIEIGASLKTIASGWREDHRAGGDLALAVSKVHELTQYRAHPALVDGALQLTALGSSTSGVDNQPVEPISIDRVTLHGSFESVMRADVAFDNTSQPLCTRADVTLTTARGAVALEIRGLRLARRQDAVGRTRRPDDYLFQLEWRPAPDAAAAQGAKRAVSFSGTWLIVDEAGEVSAPLAVRLRERGAAVRILGASELAPVIAQQRPTDLAAILYVASDAAPAVSAGREARPSPAARAMTVSQQLVEFFNTLPDDVPTWLVTAGAQCAREGERVALALAPVWGLGRAFAEEHPERWGGLIDVAADDNPSEAAAAVVCALSSGDGDDQIAVREGVRHMFRLSQAKPGAGRGVSLYPDASYLIAGGLGELGLQVARSMVEQGARRLILLGRTPLPPRHDWTGSHPGPVAGRIAAIRSLEASGATVHVGVLDVAERPALSAFLETFAAEGWPPIRGVVQCAGVLEGRLLEQLDASTLHRVLLPKVVGTWNLHELTATAPLDFFVAFSSMAALLPSPGQGSYAAGNAFLDALAYERHALGLPALSINWGPWAEIGMAAALADNSSRLASSGIGPLAPHDAVAAFSRAVGRRSPQMAIISIDRPAAGRRRTRPAMLQSLEATPLEADGQPAVNGAGDLRQSMTSAPSVEARRAILEAVLLEQIGAVLKRPAARIELTRPLRTMGLESLLALELRNRLETLTSVRLPATLAWNYPTVAVLVPFLASKMGIDLAAPAAAVFATAAPGLAGFTDLDHLKDLLDEMEGMSDAEARRLTGEGL
ncbi:MAG: acyltransferase domain-containing protein, partial [Acidobacteriota bacterium]